MSSDTAISTAGLTKHYPGVQALTDLSLDVPAGSIYGFLGPNGAGKSTTLKILGGLIRPTAGTATVSGIPLAAGAAYRQQVGYLAQEPRFYDWMSGRETLRYVASLSPDPTSVAPAWIDEVLGKVGLADAGDRRTKTYSGGMKRRLDLASALVHSPEVLFLDEPTTGLDPASRRTVWEEVRRINTAGTTVFLTTQYLEEADQLCDRLGIIDAGVIVAEGTPEHLKAQMGHDVVTLALDGADAAATEAALRDLPGLERIVTDVDGLALYLEDGAGSIAEIVRRLDRGGIRVGAIAVSRPTLDDVFLQATGRRLEGAKEEQAA
jgi:ABC-2 type transport system ATP-binding protein